MLERLDNVPSEVTGLRAMGTVSEEDYELVVIPLLEEARRDGPRIRLLFHFGPEFDGFTAGAVWEDVKVGWRYLRLFERCAVVSDRQEGLSGLVIHVREFPGWEDLGSALRHTRFVRDHHRQIPRVAFASDSRLAALAPTLAEHFLAAEIEHFDWDALHDAIHWASGRPTMA